MYYVKCICNGRAYDVKVFTIMRAVSNDLFVVRDSESSVFLAYFYI